MGRSPAGRRFMLTPEEMLRHHATNLDDAIAAVGPDIAEVDPTTADILTD